MERPAATLGNIRRSIQICILHPLFLAAVAAECRTSAMYETITLAALIALSWTETLQIALVNMVVALI
jgi:hypothetical protein